MTNPTPSPSATPITPGIAGGGNRPDGGEGNITQTPMPLPKPDDMADNKNPPLIPPPTAAPGTEETLVVPILP